MTQPHGRTRVSSQVRFLKRIAASVDESRQKPSWQRFLESAGGAALVTVIVGGILGSLINAWVQNQLKERETNLAIVKARGDQALVAYKEYLGQEQELIKHAYELIGNCIADSENLIVITGANFADENIDPASRKETRDQRIALRQKFNATDQKWRSEREVLGYLMSYYHQNQSNIVAAWEGVQNSVSIYMTCTEDKYAEYSIATPTREMVLTACKKEKEDIREQLVKFTLGLETTRRYAWKGYESSGQVP